jgi:hypothetical protein
MLTQRAGLSASTRLAVRAVATVRPFRTNTYVTEELIDWELAPDDPMYRLVFPQPDMAGQPSSARFDPCATWLSTSGRPSPSASPSSGRTTEPAAEVAGEQVTWLAATGPAHAILRPWN